MTKPKDTKGILTILILERLYVNRTLSNLKEGRYLTTDSSKDLLRVSNTKVYNGIRKREKKTWRLIYINSRR